MTFYCHLIKSLLPFNILSSVVTRGYVGLNRSSNSNLLQLSFLIVNIKLMSFSNAGSFSFHSGGNNRIFGCYCRPASWGKSTCFPVHLLPCYSSIFKFHFSQELTTAVVFSNGNTKLVFIKTLILRCLFTRRFAILTNMIQKRLIIETPLCMWLIYEVKPCTAIWMMFNPESTDKILEVFNSNDTNGVILSVI